MKYRLLPYSYKYDVIVENIHAREVNLFTYQFNIDSYMDMLARTMDEEKRGPLEQRIRAEREQMEIEYSAYQALLNQITDEDAYNQAVERWRTKNVSA